MMHDPKDLIDLFDGLFAASYRTRLERSDDEPLYLPAADEAEHHRLLFAHGFFSSALHEISHWCIAGPERRRLEDYGYWYIPDGRNDQQQAAFEQVEVAPQALERILCKACAYPFNVSVDNLEGDATINRAAFETKVVARSECLLEQGLPVRVRALYEALTAFYRQGHDLAEAIALGQAVLEKTHSSASG